MRRVVIERSVDRRGGIKMEQRRSEWKKVKETLSLSPSEDELGSGILVNPPKRPGYDPSFFEGFSLHGIRVDCIRPGFLSCSFTVPPRLTDRDGRFSSGAIANLVDEIGGAVMRSDGHHTKVSVDMSISFLSPAKIHDELEITSRVLGHKGGYSGTMVLLKNKKTGEIVAEGRHSLFGNLLSKV